MAEVIEARDYSQERQPTASPQSESEPRQQPPRHKPGARTPVKRAPASRRLCLTGEENLLIHNLLSETEFWKHTRNRQMKLFNDMVQRIKSDIDIPFRDLSRPNFTCDNIKSLVKNMPQFVSEKRKKFESKRKELEFDDEELEESLSKAEQFQFKTLLISEKTVACLSQTISSSDAAVQDVQASAAALQNRRKDRRINSEKHYAQRKRKASKLEAENENRLRLSEHGNGEAAYS